MLTTQNGIGNEKRARFLGIWDRRGRRRGGNCTLARVIDQTQSWSPRVWGPLSQHGAACQNHRRRRRGRTLSSLQKTASLKSYHNQMVLALPSGKVVGNSGSHVNAA